ncbi:permease [Parathermosynechococcus lividus PCC 6715]|uniref:Probable membrane transporter protein n=1 Tax=Parathermosynechococcus lividus PCC 6715 TaxID=1917166 RepID=A0A2D2Q2C8_PARLV|nr:permease [Thermostichus lividus PCC 6715]
MMSSLEILLIALAGIGAGFINAIAGGGTLISFPILMAAGVPPMAANITSTVALVPGYLGATLAQRQDLQGQGARLGFLVPASVLGGISGGVLLLSTSERLFGFLVPYLILLAALLLALQDPVRRWLLQRRPHGGGGRLAWAIAPVFLAALYGGYFGAGLSVILLATLGMVLEDTLTRLNGLKQLLAFAVNGAAAAFFLFSGQVLWPVVLGMAIAAVTGGLLGGKVARFVEPRVLRLIVIAVSVIVAILYLVA